MNANRIWVLLIAASAARAGTIVSVDWKNAVGVTAHGFYSGAEPLATAANSDFGAASVWNSAIVGYNSPETSPSFSNLVDSAGNPTSIGFAFTGQVDSYTGQDGSCPNSLFCDFIFLNSGSLDWTITGLTPNAVANLYFYNYGSPYQGYRVFNMALDTTGNGSLDSNYTVDPMNGVYAGGIQTSAAGTLHGQMQCCLSGQASWSGFQLDIAAPAPEPGSLLLLVAGFGVAGSRLRKRQIGHA